SYAVTLDNNGRELSRERLRSAGGMVRVAPAVAQPAPGPGLGPGQAAPPAAAGAGAGAAGGGGGGGGGGPAPLPLRASDWNDLQVVIDANIVRPNVNGSSRGGGATPDSTNGFGAIALYVGGAGEVTFRDLAVKDLNVRHLAAEQV